MGNKSQRKKERRAKRRNDKQKKQARGQARQQQFQRRADIPLASNARHRERLAQQVPRVWPGEIAEDAAVFEDAALSSLPPELALQATAVRDALRDALELRGDDALKQISAIPRGSPMSDWRLFLRGLIDWLAGNTEIASEAWKRLDPARRPGRMATVMMVALRPDLEQASPHQEPQGSDEPSDESPTSAWNRFDAQQLYHAKLLRRVRFDRAALRIAETGLKVPEESNKLQLGPTKLRWLQQFIAEYGETEPELAAALAQAGLGRAFAQNYSDLFDEAAATLKGPRHDRRNKLLTCFYYSRFSQNPSAEQRAERALQAYLQVDLPQNETLSAAMRGAIASQIHLNEAKDMMPAAGRAGMLDMFFAQPENPRAIRDHLLAAQKAACDNGPAYKAHADWIQAKLDDDRLAKAERTRFENELPGVMQRWSEGIPDAVEPRLWLVDHLLENEELEAARPHVEFLAASRHDDPRVRATPWKWQLLEAMRLCRRKAWLASAPARLDEAEALWPTWMPKQWLPYLRAAWTLRNRQTDAFEEERRQICAETGRVRDSLADACLMLGAAQRMRRHGRELKPLRAAVDGALKQIATLPLEDLFETGSFFWDLHRAQLLYPAYRMHGKAIGTALLARLAKTAKQVPERIDDERLQKAVLWASEYRFWPSAYETKLPSFFSEDAVQRHPIFAAAMLNAFLHEQFALSIKKHPELGPRLREAAASQRDAYNRHWFLEMANAFDDVMAERSKSIFGFPFGNLFNEDDDDDDDDDDLGFDPECDCPDCTAARKAHEKASSSQQGTLF